MANRALTAKLERAKRQVRELATAETLKPFYLAQGRAIPFSAAELQGVKVKTCDDGAVTRRDSRSDYHRGKGSTATPQMRGFMNAAGFAHSAPRQQTCVVQRWVGPEQVLIPTAR